MRKHYDAAPTSQGTQGHALDALDDCIVLCKPADDVVDIAGSVELRSRIDKRLVSAKNHRQNGGDACVPRQGEVAPLGRCKERSALDEVHEVLCWARAAELEGLRSVLQKGVLHNGDEV